MTEVQELVARLRLRDDMSGPLRKVRVGLSGVSDALNHPRMQRGIEQIGTGLKRSAAIAAVGIAALTTQVIAGLGQLAELEDVTTQTNAAIESTGGVAGITAKQVRDMAEEYENLNAIFDDKVIQSGENLLLTFTNIRKEAFEPALEAALDLSVAMDQDLNTSVLQLGKALNDPVRGLTALRRVGVQFTKAQEDQIKALVETGDLLGAQKVILQELGTEFGGRFAAQGKTAKGAIAGIGDAVEDLQKGLATALFPAIQKVLPRLRELLTSPEFQRGAEELGKSIAGLFSDENINTGVSLIKSALAVAKEAAPIVAEAARTMATIVGAAVKAFTSLPPEIQKLAIGAFAINKLTGGLVTNIAGGLISSVLKQLVSGVVNVQGAVVNVNGAMAPGGTAPGGGGGTGVIGALGAAGAGAAVVTAIQGVEAEVAKGVFQAQGHSAEQSANLAQLSVSLSPMPLFGVMQQVQRFLSGDQRSLLQRIGDESAATGPKINAHLGPKLIANQAAAERIRAEVNASSNRAAGDSQSERITITNAAIANQKAIGAKIETTRSEMAGVRAAINAKKLSVTTNVAVNTAVSVRETIYKQTTYKQYFKVAS